MSLQPTPTLIQTITGSNLLPYFALGCFFYGAYVIFLRDQDSRRSIKSKLPAETERGKHFMNTKNRTSYRIEEETSKALSSEYTRRGQLWSRHAAWHLPNAPRTASRVYAQRGYRAQQGIEHVQAILQKFDVDPNTGFLPAKDPLQRLPYARYHIWEDLGDDLSKLLGARLGQARGPLSQLPVLSTDKIVTDAELRRAHLLLCLFAHGYIWGGNTPLDHLPEGIAKPLWEVSERLGIPPVLGHPSIVLYNWRRLDIHADICMENLSTLNNFFDGRDESWFYLITVEIEAKGAAAIVPMMLATDAIQRHNEEEKVLAQLANSHQGSESKQRGCMSPTMHRRGNNDQPKTKKYKLMEREDFDYQMEGYQSPDSSEDSDNVIFTNEALLGQLDAWRVSVFVTAQLAIVSRAIAEITRSLSSMREGCHPFIFYHRVRPFLSGWKHNPTMPKGVVYEGVSHLPMQFFGGSAAQSSLLPFFDITLGITHDSNKSRDFLLAMRDYMLKPHREFLLYIEQVACVRPFIEKRIAELEEGKLTLDCREIVEKLRTAYDSCVQNLQAFRTGHISLVAEYIIAQQKEQNKGKPGALEGSAGGKGTGGTELMSFLKPIRDDCVNKILDEDDRNKQAEIMGVQERNEAAAAAANPSAAPTWQQPSQPSHKQQSFIPGSVAASIQAGNVMQAEAATSITAIMNESDDANDIYYKDNGSIEDIDLFRGAVRPSVKHNARSATNLLSMPQLNTPGLGSKETHSGSLSAR